MVAYVRNPQSIPDDTPGGSTVRQAVKDQNSTGAIDDLFVNLNSHSNNEDGKSHVEIDQELNDFTNNLLPTVIALTAETEGYRDEANVSETNAANSAQASEASNQSSASSAAAAVVTKNETQAIYDNTLLVEQDVIDQGAIQEQRVIGEGTVQVGLCEDQVTLASNEADRAKSEADRAESIVSLCPQWITKAVGYTASHGDAIAVDTSLGSVTITLPDNPVDNVCIFFADASKTFGDNSMFVALSGTGETIEGDADLTMEVSSKGASFALTYNATKGHWVIV